MFAKVLSWCGSRLGGSAPMTASKTPPRRGVSAAWSPVGIATTEVARNATRVAVNSLEQARIRVIIDTSRRRGAPGHDGRRAPRGATMLGVARMLAGAARGCQQRFAPLLSQRAAALPSTAASPIIADMGLPRAAASSRPALAMAALLLTGCTMWIDHFVF